MKSERVLGFVLIAAVAVSCGGSPPTGGGDTSSMSVATSPSPSPSPTQASPDPEGPVMRIPPPTGDYHVKIDPKKFVSVVDNPYFPLEPGTTHVFEGTSGGRVEVDTVTVTNRTKVILGVTCIVVRDEVSIAGELQELTFDWYTQDVDGNVWYFGEDSKEYSQGVVTGTGGSWEAGVNGAQPGVIMLADPRVGTAYRQEFYRGEAEDTGKVVALGAHVSVPAGSFDDVVVTQDFTPLEPAILERKYYAPGVGVVLEELIEGGEEVSRLVHVRH